MQYVSLSLKKRGVRYKDNVQNGYKDVYVCNMYLFQLNKNEEVAEGAQCMLQDYGVS